MIKSLLYQILKYLFVLVRNNTNLLKSAGSNSCLINSKSDNVINHWDGHYKAIKTIVTVLEIVSRVESNQLQNHLGKEEISEKIVALDQYVLRGNSIFATSLELFIVTAHMGG